MAELPTRSLGRTGIRARALGLGCATFGVVRPDYGDADAVAAVRHLALQFSLSLEIDGIILPGPRTVAEVDDAYRAATTPVPIEVWQRFGERFGVAPARALSAPPAAR